MVVLDHPARPVVRGQPEIERHVPHRLGEAIDDAVHDAVARLAVRRLGSHGRYEIITFVCEGWAWRPTVLGLDPFCPVLHVAWTAFAPSNFTFALNFL